MNPPSEVENYIRSHPKYPWQLFILIILSLWHSLLTVTTLLFYFTIVKPMRINPWQTMLWGAIAIFCYFIFSPKTDALTFVMQHFQENKLIWQLLLTGYLKDAWFEIYTSGLDFLFAFTLATVGLVSIFDLMPENIHAKALRNVLHGRQDESQELNEHTANKMLKKLPSYSEEGTALGISKYSGEKVIIPDKHINQIILAVGTTGAGKSVTLRRFFERAIKAGIPLIVTDGKPSEETADWLKHYANKEKRPFLGFNCDDFMHYNSLVTGSFTELKDRIMCIKDTWSSDHYKSIAEDYLQTTLAVLLHRKQPFDLKTIADCLDYTELLMITRAIKDKALLHAVTKLEQYDSSDIAGLQAHLNVFINSELGQYLLHHDNAFHLKQAIDSKAMVYFSLPVLQYPGFVPVFANLVINDLKAVMSRNHKDNKVFIVFDEFSAFSSNQVLNLVNMGRGQGAHSIFGTQGIPDLRTVNPTFADQVLNCVNTIICHRVNDQDSAQSIADWIGTADKFAVTAQLDLTQSANSVGSVRSTKEYIIHPDSFKQALGIGEAFYVTKVDGFKTDKIKVKY